MPYQIQITVKNAEELRSLSSSIASVIQELTGSRPSIRVYNRKKQLEKTHENFKNINRKLLK